MKASYLVNALANLPRVILMRSLWRNRFILHGLLMRSSIGAHFKCSGQGVVEIGERVIVQRGTQIESDGGSVFLGDGVFINRNCSIVARSLIEIGDETSIGPNVMIYDHDHLVPGLNDEETCSEAIQIGKKVWIGAGSLILKGVKVGDGCVIAAGTLVTSDVPANSVLIQKRNKMLIEIEDQ